MPDFEIGETSRKEKGAIRVSPPGCASGNNKMRRKIIGPGQRRTVVGVVAGLGGTPLQPMFGGLADSTALKKAAHAVESARHRRHGGGRNPILIDLGDGAVVAVVL